MRASVIVDTHTRKNIGAIWVTHCATESVTFRMMSPKQS